MKRIYEARAHLDRALALDPLCARSYVLLSKEQRSSLGSRVSTFSLLKSWLPRFPLLQTVQTNCSGRRDLVAYAKLLAGETDQPADPVKLIAPMLARFMATDRGFARARRPNSRSGPSSAPR